jgi:hypothetical protein
MKQRKGSLPDDTVVDEFIERYYLPDGCSLKLEADNYKFKDTTGQVSKSLRTLLNDAIKGYIVAKRCKANLVTMMDKTKYVSSHLQKNFCEASTNEVLWLKNCLEYINFAKKNDLIMDAASLTYILNKCKDENEQLKKEKVSLQEKNVELMEENKRLHVLDANYQSGKTEVGDLEKP